MNDHEQRRNSKAIILEGERGKEIFEEIKNAPETSHEELEKEVEESKKKILEERASAENREQADSKNEAQKKKYDVPVLRLDDILDGKVNIKDYPHRCFKIAKEDAERAYEYFRHR